MGLRVKICGITQPDQGLAIAQLSTRLSATLGATALGFICVPTSPRYVTIQQIAAIVAALPTHWKTGKPVCDRIGVFVNADLDLICQTVALGRLNGVQLHGDESPELCDRLRQALPGIELIKAFRIRSTADLSATRAYQESVDALLLDAYHPTLAGGTGETLDWSTLQSFRPSLPWFLAGGLTPGNILEALTQLQPHGIDLSSGVEISPGNKDLKRVAQLFEILQPIINSMPEPTRSPEITTFTQRLTHEPDTPSLLILPLTAEDRTRSRHHFATSDGQSVYLQLPRGTVLQDGDWLQADDGAIVRVIAKPEPVMTATAHAPLHLLQAAYHLGNRHVPLEIAPTYLRFSPDPVLRDLLIHRGLHVVEETQPFQPESGAYGHHSHS